MYLKSNFYNILQTVPDMITPYFHNPIVKCCSIFMVNFKSILIKSTSHIKLNIILLNRKKTLR